MSTTLLLEVAPEIDTNPTSFYRGRSRGGSVRLRLGLAMSVHPTYFDLATPLFILFHVRCADAFKNCAIKLNSRAFIFVATDAALRFVPWTVDLSRRYSLLP